MTKIEQLKKRIRKYSIYAMFMLLFIGITMGFIGG